MPNIVELSNAALNLERSQSASLRKRVEMLNPNMTNDELEEEVERIKEEQGEMPIPPNQLGG
jgi:isopropylmalate/homocitrate/citramalate synthase